MPASSPDLCRITVVGPAGRADLAVPHTTSLAEVMPQLMRYVVTADQVPQDGEGHASWVLQRLGDAPLDPDATPEQHGWTDGEVLHLVRAEEPLPELDFDDLADGVAESVTAHHDRWGAGAQRRLFTALAVTAGCAALALLAREPSRALAVTAAAAAATAVAAWSVGSARAGAEAVTTGWGAVLATAFAWLAGARWQGPLGAGTLLVGGAVVATLAAAMIAARATLAPALPRVPAETAAVVAAGSLLAAWLALGTGLGPGHVAAVVAVTAVLVALIAPRLAVRMGGIVVPQLPRSARELQIDVDPVVAEEVAGRARAADEHLSALVIGCSALLVPSLLVLRTAPGWAGPTLLVVVVTLVLLRAREVVAVRQRLAYTTAGVAGLAAVLAVITTRGEAWRAVTVAALVVLALVLAAAARRPLYRRLRPVWRHTANVVEGVLAVATVPLLLQVLGVYAWARGLGG